MRNAAKKIYITLIFLFLYAPIGTLMVLSFNASRTRAKWGGFTFKWYVELFQNDDILRALGNTLLIALVSSDNRIVPSPNRNPKLIKRSIREIPVTISAFNIGILVTPIIMVLVRFFIPFMAMQAMVPMNAAVMEETSAISSVLPRARRISSF